MVRWLSVGPRGEVAGVTAIVAVRFAILALEALVGRGPKGLEPWRTFPAISRSATLSRLRSTRRSPMRPLVSVPVRGETFSAIGRRFGVDPNTVKKALRWLRQP